MARLLTLSISQTYKNKYKIVAFNIDSKEFVALQINQSEFRNLKGTICWDLFGVTHIDRIIPSGDEFSKPIGVPKLLDVFNRDQMVSFLDSNKISAKRFLFGKLDYGIIKINQITKIKDSRVYFIPEQHIGDPIDLKNKDFRWINYWKNINEDECESKTQQWMDYINQHDKQKYLVLYHRKQFENPKFNKWIVGFHCL